MFLETSAKTGHAVEEAFLKCSKNILAKIETGELDPERIGSGKSTGRLLIADIYISISMGTFGHRKYKSRGEDGNK